MQNLLKKNQQGFTLVELLVAIAIIAILAIIGLTVFTGLQRGARDATRRSDVQAISKALEANYSTTGGAYTNLSTSMFAGGSMPVDPLATTQNCNGHYCNYCMSVAVNGSLPNPSGGLQGSAGTTCGTGSNSQVVGPGSPAIANVTGYIVCTNLETGPGGGVPADYYCQGSQR